MAEQQVNNLPETKEWTAGIRQLEVTDLAEGGPNGVMNTQAKQLANRTAYLRDELEKTQASIPGTEEFDRIKQELSGLDVSKVSSRTDHLERVVGDLALALDAAMLYPDADALVVENFDNPDQIDLFSISVISVVSGDDSIDVTDSSGIVIGANYVLTDGVNQEAVQVKNIHVADITHRVILDTPVSKQYVSGRAKLYRSSTAIYSGRAYGGGILKDYKWSPSETWSGSGTQQAAHIETVYNSSKSLDFTASNVTFTTSTVELIKNGIDDNNTLSLLHFNDSIIDESGKIWTPGGGAVVSIAQKKFGSSALYLDGIDDYLSTPAIDFSTGDFSIDCWVYYLAATGTFGAAALSTEYSLGFSPFSIRGDIAEGTQIYSYISGSSGSWSIAAGKPFSTVKLNQWLHYYIGRQGNTFYMAENGVIKSTWTSAETLANVSGYNFLIGRSMTDSEKRFKGYIDEFRFCKGIARWTANFTPPTAPYGGYSPSGLVKTNMNSLDLTNLSSISALAITQNTPTNTNVKYALKKGTGTWKGWSSGTSTWTDLANQDLSQLASQGNTKADLEARTSAQLDWLKGTGNVHIATCLTSSDPTVTPSVSEVRFNGQTGSQTLVKTVTSDAYTLTSTGNPVDILSITPETYTLGGGTVLLEAAIQNSANTWGAWGSLSALVTSPPTKAKAIKFRATLTVAAVGTDQASVSKITIKHRIDDVSVFAEGEGVIITQTYNFQNAMSSAHLMVKHPNIQDVEIKAYVSLRPKPVLVTGEVLGVGDGKQHTYRLAHPRKIATHTFALYFAGTKQTAGYAFSSETGDITCTAPVGAAVTADYQYNWESETWEEMVHDNTYPDSLNSFMVNDQFNYRAVDTTDPQGAVSSVKIKMVQNKGTESNKSLGLATGALQALKLDHKAKSESIVLKCGDSAISYTFNPDINTVYATGTAGQALTVTYDWVADTPWVDNFACIWNA